MYNLFNNSNQYTELWTDDNSVNSCHNCRNDFTFLNRRHHCRLCGKIFCNICCNYFINTNLDNKLIIIEDFLLECLNIDNIIKYKKKKLCYQCYQLLLNIKKIARFIKIFELLPINLDDIYKLLYVNKIWNKSIVFYLNNFKNIQYSNVSNYITNTQLKMLNNNKLFICGHSKLITLFIINHNWTNYTNSEITNILGNLQIRKISCKLLLCNNNCSEKLDNFNILYILKYTKNKYIKSYLLDLLDAKLIHIFLPLLINYIENDSSNDYSITYYLIKNCNNISLLIELFFQIFIIINNTNKIIYKNSLQLIKNNLIKHQSEKYDSIINSIKLINLLCNLNINNIKTDINNINTFIRNNIVYIPLNNEDIVDYISEDIIIKDSNTKPLLLKVNFKNGKSKSILFKKEDLRIDYIISKIILLIKNILSVNKIDTNLITYNILPINSNSGLIEIIDDSYTLYDIKKNLELSLQNFILSNNKNQTIEIIKRKFSNSLSIYSVITYVLGVGDRHLDNIMVTKNGVIFHIDYSFCIGQDPKPFFPSMRITDEMIDMIGGFQSNDYKKFINNCNIYYNCIRKKTNIISLYIFLLNNIDNVVFNTKSLKNHIIKKFIVMESDIYANNTLHDTIINSTDNYNYIDFFHYHSKEKTVSKTVFNLYDNSLLLTDYLKKYFKDLY